jgi:hypothetical protein
MSEWIVVLLGLWIVILGLMAISHRQLNRRQTQMKNAFATAFKEWAESCDWMGYDEIPTEMYFDLANRIETAALTH